jgi:hypothetical protein
MHLCLPHPDGLDVLPFFTNMSATTHPLKGQIFGFINSTISYKHFYFYQGHILQTKVFATSTTMTTVSDVSKLKGSTELDMAAGHNCAMMKEEYHQR